jgi:hypothetical protein
MTKVTPRPSRPRIQSQSVRRVRSTVGPTMRGMPERTRGIPPGKEEGGARGEVREKCRKGKRASCVRKAFCSAIRPASNRCFPGGDAAEPVHRLWRRRVPVTEPMREAHGFHGPVPGPGRPLPIAIRWMHCPDCHPARRHDPAGTNCHPASDPDSGVAPAP